MTSYAPSRRGSGSEPPAGAWSPASLYMNASSSLSSRPGIGSRATSSAGFARHGFFASLVEPAEALAVVRVRGVLVLARVDGEAGGGVVQVAREDLVDLERDLLPLALGRVVAVAEQAADVASAPESRLDRCRCRPRGWEYWLCGQGVTPGGRKSSGAGSTGTRSRRAEAERSGSRGPTRHAGRSPAARSARCRAVAWACRPGLCHPAADSYPRRRAPGSPARARCPARPPIRAARAERSRVLTRVGAAGPPGREGSTTKGPRPLAKFAPAFASATLVTLP